MDIKASEYTKFAIFPADYLLKPVWVCINCSSYRRAQVFSISMQFSAAVIKKLALHI